MSTIFTILLFVQANSSTIIQVQQSVFFSLSALFQLIKMPKTSKFFGTWAIDGGRLIRWITNPKRIVALKTLVSLLPKAKANLTLLFIALNISGCVQSVPAKAPTAMEIAVSATNLTDAALAAAIEFKPELNWLPSVVAVETTRDMINTGGKICETLPDLKAVASAINCAKCTELILVTQEALSCQ